jgi:hypothetical protein
VPRAEIGSCPIRGASATGSFTIRYGDTMLYTITPYNFDGLSCDSATFPGTVG